MMLTNTEYMSDKARVERVVERLLGLSVQDFREAKGQKQIDFMLEPIINVESLAPEKVQRMTYLELACMVDNISNDPGYDWDDHDRFAEQQSAYYCLAGALFNGSSVSTPIKLFMELPIKAYYDYLRAKYRKSSLLDEYDKIISCCNYEDGFTIRDFLAEKVEAARKAWLPVMPLQKYEQEIRTAHQDMGRLLVDSLRIAMPRAFDVPAICCKYSKYNMEIEPQVVGGDDLAQSDIFG